MKDTDIMSLRTEREWLVYINALMEVKERLENDIRIYTEMLEQKKKFDDFIEVQNGV